jgi:hypothetical protein
MSASPAVATRLSPKLAEQASRIGNENAGEQIAADEQTELCVVDGEVSD